MANLLGMVGGDSTDGSYKGKSYTELSPPTMANLLGMTPKIDNKAAIKRQPSIANSIILFLLITISSVLQVSLQYLFPLTLGFQYLLHHFSYCAPSTRSLCYIIHLA